MNGPQPAQRMWFVNLVAGEARLRCSFRRCGNTIEQFTVQLEVCVQESWHAVVRYDNAHGFCHRDTLHADGTQDKTPIFVGDVNETFTHAIEDLRAGWKAHYLRFVKEIES